MIQHLIGVSRNISTFEANLKEIQNNIPHQRTAKKNIPLQRKPNKANQSVAKKSLLLL